jgi:hypothetical protein
MDECFPAPARLISLSSALFSEIRVKTGMRLDNLTFIP